MKMYTLQSVGCNAFYSNHKSSDFPEFSQSLKCQSKSTGSGIYYNFTVADPDLELTGWGGLDLLALLAFFPSVISSLFT